MSVKINRIIRNGTFAIALYTEAGEVKKKEFPLSVSNEKILSFLSGKKTIPEAEKVTAEKEPVPEAGKKEMPQKVAEQIEDKRTLKAKYLRELKEKGVSTAGLITFTDVEEAYKKANGGE